MFAQTPPIESLLTLLECLSAPNKEQSFVYAAKIHLTEEGVFLVEYTNNGSGTSHAYDALVTSVSFDLFQEVRDEGYIQGVRLNERCISCIDYQITKKGREALLFLESHTASV